MKISPFSNKSKIGKKIMGVIQHYDHEKYWRRRQQVVDPNSKCGLIKKLYYLLYIKRCDSWNNCSFGTNINSGAEFATPPILWHGPNGIIVGADAKIGKDCIICQQVTIEYGADTVIGDNVMLGAGAKVIKGVKIGNNAKIGANCVVVEDIPAGATCVLPKPRIILKSKPAS